MTSIVLQASVCKNIRIYYECEGRIEKSIPRITVWHHEAWRVMPNGDPEEWIFQYYPHTNTVNPVLNGHSKIDKTKVLMTNGSLMKVKSIAECSLGAFCNTFDLH